MDVWISFYNTHMANNLVKWWRTKFLNGYKQFSDCGDVKVSDTEELLGRNDSEDENFDRIKYHTPPFQERLNRASPKVAPSENNEEPSKTETPRQLNFEEFFCDVSMENSDPPGQEKQEFSFTLYDFDGHGKITKDDIAGLVTTIYEALGSSVKVPHCGSKTIKVKLTVSPEKQTSEQQKTQSDNSKNIRYKKDINVTIRQGTKATRIYCNSNSKTRKKHGCCKMEEEPQQKHHHCCKKEEEHEEQTFVSDDFSDACSRLSSVFSSEDECENDQFSDQEHSPQRTKQKKYTKKSNSRYTIPSSFLKDIYNNKGLCKNNKKGRKRSSSSQRQELLKIIQANMEKNNLSFQTIGKPCTQDNSEGKSLSTETKYHHKHKTTKTETSPFHNYLSNMVDPTQFYVDLASLQNATQLPANYKYDKLIDAVIGVSNGKHLMTSQGKHKKHNRSNIECENVMEYPLIDSPVNEEIKSTPKIKKVNESSNKKSAKKTQGVTGHTSSPHYLRHRNRQEDQARAMAQVVRWLEQEFSSNLSMKDTWERAKQHNSYNSEKDPSSGPNMSKNVERHEHHHVHEHIHHHYHHYQDSPCVI